MRYNERIVPYRIAAPPDPDPAEIEDPYAAVLRAQRRRARMVSALVLVFCGAGLAKVALAKVSPAEHSSKARTTRPESARIDRARSAIASARARAASEQVRFETALRGAIDDGVVARPDLGVCPITLPAASSLVLGRSSFPLLTVERSEIGGAGTLPSQAVAAVLADVRRAESHLAAGRFEEAALYGRALDRAERFSYDVVLVADADKKPRALSGSAYEPGDIAGRAFVYDFASGKVVCAGDVHAKSSRSIGYVYSDRTDAPASLGAIASMTDAIREDIRLQTERAIIDAIHHRSGRP